MNSIFKNTFRLRSNSEHEKVNLVFKKSKKTNEYSSLMATSTSQTSRKGSKNYLPKIFINKRKISNEYPSKNNKNEIFELKNSASNFFEKKTKSKNELLSENENKGFNLNSIKNNSCQNILRNTNSKKNSSLFLIKNNNNTSLFKTIKSSAKIFNSKNNSSNKIISRGKKKRNTFNNRNSQFSLINIDKNKINPIKYKHFEISKAGLDEDGEEKTNQDRFIYLEKLFNLPDTYCFGVLDGHGPNGHLVSEFVKNELTEFLTNDSNFKTKHIKEINHENLYSRLTHNNYSLLQKLYKNINNKLNDQKFDVHFSGTTCVLVFIIKENIICSNIGDSRAILIKEEKGKYYYENLSYDHKPNKEEERKRIEQSGGEIHPCLDTEDDDVLRVWIKGDNNIPGIAVSRTIGDSVSKDIGVTYVADIIEKKIDENYCYIIVGSDGIWDFMENQRIVNLSKNFYEKNDTKQMCDMIVKEAVNAWRIETIDRDDITCIVFIIKEI